MNMINQDLIKDRKAASKVSKSSSVAPKVAAAREAKAKKAAEMRLLPATADPLGPAATLKEPL